MTDNKELIRRPAESSEIRDFLDLVKAAEDYPELAEQLRKWAATKVAEAKRTKNAPVWHESPVSRLVHTWEANWKENK